MDNYTLNEKKNNKLIVEESIESIDGLESMADLKIQDNKSSEYTNFIKQNFTFNEINYEIAFSLYSNMIFIIITNNSKLGNIWLAEVEEEYNEPIIDEETEILFDLKCILGERNNQFYHAISHMIISKTFALFVKKNIKPKNVMVSLAFKSTEIDENESNKDFFVISQSVKQFLEIINKSIESIF